MPATPTPQTFLLADLDADHLNPDAAHTWLTDTGMVFFFPLRTPALFRMLTMRPPDDPDTPVTLELLQAITGRATGGRVRLRDPVWLSDFRLHNRGATHHQTGRIVLAGDAAHVHSPAGAQGMNTGIQDAANLGWKLALACRGHADPGLLDTYEPERAPVGHAVLRMSDRAFTIATTRNPLVRFARTHLVPQLTGLDNGPNRQEGLHTVLHTKEFGWSSLRSSRFGTTTNTATSSSTRCSRMARSNSCSRRRSG